MFCFPRKSRNVKYQNLAMQPVLSISIPVISRENLPILPEHKIQNPYEEIIDDPSIIFFDPDEKPGFTYKSVPFISQGLDFTYEEPQFNSQESLTDLQQNLWTNNKFIENLPSSPQYADSLDGNSRPITPPPIRDTSFERGCSSMGLRKDSLEFDGMNDVLSYPPETFLPRMESTRNTDNQQDLQQNTFHENSYIDDFGGINLYEDNLLSGVQLNYANKGYTSDAESVKTYQDSGIYDDDLDESPKSLASVARQLVFGNENYMDQEKYTAFKTPMSSRQSSVESLIMENYNNEFERRSFDGKFNNEENSSNGSEVKDLISPGKATIKTSNRYSHVQAKVQCYRTKADRSPSPGRSLKNKSSGTSSKSPGSNRSPGSSRPRSTSPGASLKNQKTKRTKSPGGTYTQETISSANKSKTKQKNTDKSSHDRSKIFNEKLRFREQAKARTDSHGVEMYSNLPKEFQEIARRLARQDRELKKSETDLRGRSLSRKSSRFTSRASSISPTRSVRSKSESRNEGNMEVFSYDKENETPSKALSRSSSIRSIPSTPALSRQHPLPELQARAKSPGASPGRSPAHRLSHSKERNTKKSTTSVYHKKESTPSPVSKLYTFTTVNDSFGNSPIDNASGMLPIQPVR